MDNKDWEILKIIAEEKSAMKTAERMYMSQPAIVYRLNRMEEEMDAHLFIRTNKGITLTSAGERLLSFADKMLQQNTYIKSCVHMYSASSLSGTVKLGTATTFANKFLPYQLRDFYARYPKISVSIVNGLNNELVKKIRDSELMVAVVRGDHGWKGNSFHIYDEPLVIISPKPITNDMLNKLPFIHYAADPTLLYSISCWIKENFQTPPNRVIESAKGTQICMQMVKAGLGWSIIPVTRTFGEEGLFTEIIRHKNGLPYIRSTNLIYTRSAMLIDVYQVYINSFCEFFSNFQFPQAL